MKPASALICGLVRQPGTMLHQLSMLERFRAEGLVDRIVFSTWEGELDRYPEVRETMCRLGVVVVESAQPALTLPGHVLHQAKTFTLGLYACPADALILKLRGDVLPLTAEYRRILSGEHLAAQERRATPTLFRRPVWTLSGIVFWPFYMNDMVFFGTRDDLLQLADIDVKAEYYWNQLAPEQFFHMGPVLRRSALMRAYARIHRVMITGDQGGNTAYARATLDMPLLLRGWALSAKLLVENYYTGFQSDEEVYGEATMARFAQASLGDLITGEGDLPGVEFRLVIKATTFTSSSWAMAVLQQRFRRDADAERLAEALSRLGDEDEDLDNPVYPPVEVRDAVARISGIYIRVKPRVCTLPAEERVRAMPGWPERVSVASDTDEARELEEQITALRRQILALTTENNRLRGESQG